MLMLARDEVAEDSAHDHHKGDGEGDAEERPQVEPKLVDSGFVFEVVLYRRHVRISCLSHV